MSVWTLSSEVAVNLPTSFLCHMAWTDARVYLLNEQMRTLSGFTRRRNQRKTSWVGSRERHLVSAHGLRGAHEGRAGALQPGR